MYLFSHFIPNLQMRGIHEPFYLWFLYRSTVLKSNVKKTLLSCDLPGRHHALEKNPWEKHSKQEY